VSYRTIQALEFYPGEEDHAASDERGDPSAPHPAGQPFPEYQYNPTNEVRLKFVDHAKPHRMLSRALPSTAKRYVVERDKSDSDWLMRMPTREDMMARSEHDLQTDVRFFIEQSWDLRRSPICPYEPLPEQFAQTVLYFEARHRIRLHEIHRE